ncbi:MAG: hypothetical protein P8X42_02735 [Calditrichaceae bacterium]|jgi:hypothetical protein
MKSMIYKIAILIPMLSLITLLLNGISIGTGFVRSGIIFLSILVLIIVPLYLFQQGFMKSTPVTHQPKGMDR